MTQTVTCRTTGCHEPELFEGWCRRCYTMNIPLTPVPARKPKRPSRRGPLRKRATLWMYRW